MLRSGSPIAPSPTSSRVASRQPGGQETPGPEGRAAFSFRISPRKERRGRSRECRSSRRHALAASFRSRRGKTGAVDRVRCMEKSFARHAVAAEIIRIGLPHRQKGGKAAKEQSQRRPLERAQAARLGQQMRIAPKKERNARQAPRGQDTQVTPVTIAEEQHGVGFPRRELARQRPIAQPEKMMRARTVPHHWARTGARSRPAGPHPTAP